MVAKRRFHRGWLRGVWSTEERMRGDEKAAALRMKIDLDSMATEVTAL